ncbi:uncharacterized protein LOC106638107 [Copidosoma floridanum]|uniref:uncharacterized protein LOC106638107 n=1 Tax=Copidosoma floridanum TaxID=29053 RepID=UPI0006C9E55E|nr:uncharacterized protein LOC106638107 [Copidosoma floridanum]
MANIGTVIAHMIKLAVTVLCMSFFKDSFSLKVTNQMWAIRAFQLMFIHSILGVIRYGNSNTTKRLRNFYEFLTSIIEIVPVAFFTTEVLSKYQTCEELRFFILALGLAPTTIELSSSTRIRDRSKLELFTNVIVGLQSFAVALICLWYENYTGLSLAISFAVARYVSEDFCDKYEVPYVDLSQYSFGFTQLFALAAIKDV